MNHKHEHGSQHHDVLTDMSVDEKIIKLIAHWIKHNEDHAKTYIDWAKKAKGNNMVQIGSALENAAALTMSINEKFEEALKSLQK